MELLAEKSVQPLFYSGHLRALAEPPWKDNFAEFPCWWDNRKSKTSLHAPHFLLEAERGSLLMNSFCNPNLDKNEEVAFATLQNVFTVKEDYTSSSSHGSSSAGELLSLSLENVLVSLEEEFQPQPSIQELLCIVWKCKEEKSLVFALRLHACMYKLGLEAHRSLGSHLISMFAYIGSLYYAQKVFDSLISKSESSWSSLINGYVKYGKPRHALALYENMQQISLPPSRHTFVALLKACTKIKDIERGSDIHADIAKQGLLRENLFVGSTLVDMYAKCGLLVKAQEVFDNLQLRDVVTWNALITGYTQQNCGKEALNCYRQMRLEGVSPNEITYACILKACGSIGAMEKGSEIHHEIAVKGLLQTKYLVGGALVDMYAKCGSLAKAQDAFDSLPSGDVVSWTALIGGYAQHELGEEALRCFEQMKREGVSPNAVTYACVLKACGCTQAANKGREIHAEICRMGLLQVDTVLGNALVDMYAKCGVLEIAQEVFDKLVFHDVVSWNALISGYVQHECGEEALECLKQMQLEGICPNNVTYLCSLKACGSIRALEKGCEIHAEVSQNGVLKGDLVLGNVLVDMYAKCGMLVKAQAVFDTLPTRDVVSWTALMTGYAQHDLGEEALSCFKQMQLEGVSPNAVTFTCSLYACACIGAINEGIELHAEIDREGLLESNYVLGTALVDMYAKCGLLVKAQDVFDKLPEQDIVSWNSMITGYAQLGEFTTVLFFFNRMIKAGMNPNTVTFISILNSCSHAGLVDEGKWYYRIMTQGYGIIPTLEHLTCMVDLLGRAGQVDGALAVMKQAPHDLNHVIWLTLLSACRNLSHAGIARQAFEQAVHTDEMDGAAYVCMYNICADAEMQEQRVLQQQLQMS